MAINNTYMILGLIAVVALVVVMVPGGDGEDGGVITYDCLDINQQPMDCGTGELLSIIDGGAPGVGYLNFRVEARNIGEIPLTCSIIDTPNSPSAFGVGLGSSLKIAPVGGSATWESGPIEMAPLEQLPQPVTFAATLRCSFRSGVETITIEPDLTGTIGLSIVSDAFNVGFEVDFDPPGTDEIVCGDNICHTPIEDVENCEVDCTVGVH